jgi:hypothetical protein
MNNIRDYCVHAGPHPNYEDSDWWQIAFDFESIQVSIARTPNTDGVEMKVVADEKPLVFQKQITIKQAVDVLAAILIWRGEA